MLVSADKLDYQNREFKEESYLPGPEYWETTHLVAKEELQIPVYKPWLRFNDTFVWYHLPTMASHAWKVIEKHVHSTKNAPHSTIAFL